jgi:hypothetical protein
MKEFEYLKPLEKAISVFKLDESIHIQKYEGDLEIGSVVSFKFQRRGIRMIVLGISVRTR